MKKQTFFAPVLSIPNGTTDIEFYKQAFGALEINRFSDDDGTVHNAELEIDGALFHLHEQTKPYTASPATLRGTTVTIGLFVADVDAVIAQAVAVGATVISPAEDYFYGYRQGEIMDPFGHRWMIEKAIPLLEK